MYTFENFGIKFEKTNLKNGSPTFLFKKKGAPLYIRASVNAGTRWNDIPGTAHFVEHMILAGSKKFPTKNLLVEQIESVGGTVSASTYFDSISINVQVPQEEDLPIATDILNEILSNSLFDEKVFENEKGAILSELRSKKSNPQSYSGDLFTSLIFQQTYMETPTLGDEESIINISLKDVKKFYLNYFSSTRIAYIVCGDIELDELKGILDNAIELKGKADNLLPIVPETIPTERISAQYFDNDETSLVFGFRLDGVQGLEEKVALLIIANMLAVGRVSILTKELRYKRGLVYSTGGSALFLSGTGFFSIFTSSSEKDTQEVVDVICGELNKIYTNGFDMGSFNFVKSKFLKSKFIEMQTAFSWVNANEALLNTLSIEESNTIEYMNIAESLTLKMVNEIFKKYIKPGNSYLAVCGKNNTNSLSLKF
ncbi:MAG: Peptidase M16 inactive domain family [Parcubacteria group bacterium GW2011_GWC1_42_11]|uniref:Peptidase M16 inactive domain family n=1 Tax=Candidatus Nomurabacteria bacterium GW2011_GWC2_42_20 TaxID=1618756 RepID=A0A0G0ZE08_9BACT|nr:MAG: Peptidase M16 inactive domain family [Parcubacteria group bacterium GW2011_GWC1_42_11]KKS46919.1 MAG: Peptidase M16 inactive domain family [Candidatus Nomurabacteria bacterium GW2011_GWC2_42_20]KKS58923.1 MAG: Peptidase M16 inactive domain family [Candidatus Nomurabacteria bacterium GW2011_GWA2_42_41]KKT08136.1 MAG: Peptidase M16 inactive domain family [Candidatus Nomurabacteria bacterium GW2011_GWB1_43_20]TAN35696.1 MAG: insulinase family protein [Patescibacteria group bacterium]HBH71